MKDINKDVFIYNQRDPKNLQFDWWFRNAVYN